MWGAFFRLFGTLSSGYFANDAFSWFGKVTGTSKIDEQGKEVVPAYIKIILLALISLLAVFVFRLFNKRK